MGLFSAERSPGAKLALTILIGLVLAIPLFSVWLLVYDRQSQSETARASIAEGWGGPQQVAGPLLVIPYRATVTETVTEGGRPVVRTCGRAALFTWRTRWSKRSVTYGKR